MDSENQAPQNQQTSPQKPSKGYGKRPVWQWVLIYVVIAIVVYGLVYFLFIHKSGSTGTSGY
jgi:hypothetical protein